MDCGASAPVIGMHLACKLGIWKRARKIKVKQGDESSFRVRSGDSTSCDWRSYQYAGRGAQR